jgi:NADPH-dependent 2,4-dienoyl-CoA reductase/sulfur reductase-like enzyme
MGMTLAPAFLQQIVRKYVLVAGGGPSGTAAAIAAARAGADVVLGAAR